MANDLLQQLHLGERDGLMKLAKHVYGFSDEHILLFIENELDQWLQKLDKPRAASGRMESVVILCYKCMLSGRL